MSLERECGIATFLCKQRNRRPKTSVLRRVLLNLQTWTNLRYHIERAVRSSTEVSSAELAASAERARSRSYCEMAFGYRLPLRSLARLPAGALLLGLV